VVVVFSVMTGITLHFLHVGLVENDAEQRIAYVGRAIKSMLDNFGRRATPFYNENELVEQSCDGPRVCNGRERRKVDDYVVIGKAQPIE